MFFGRFRRREEPPHEPFSGHRRRIPLIGLILMAIGLLTVLYLFITYILMPILASLTPRG